MAFSRRLPSSDGNAFLSVAEAVATGGVFAELIGSLIVALFRAFTRKKSSNRRLRLADARTTIVSFLTSRMPLSFPESRQPSFDPVAFHSGKLSVEAVQSNIGRYGQNDLTRILANVYDCQRTTASLILQNASAGGLCGIIVSMQGHEHATQFEQAAVMLCTRFPTAENVAFVIRRTKSNRKMRSNADMSLQQHCMNLWMQKSHSAEEWYTFIEGISPFPPANIWEIAVRSFHDAKPGTDLQQRFEKRFPAPLTEKRSEALDN